MTYLSLLEEAVNNAIRVDLYPEKAMLSKSYHEALLEEMPVPAPVPAGLKVGNSISHFAGQLGTFVIEEDVDQIEPIRFVFAG